ncbi:E3 ubiquitin-protein ligase RNF138-like isoform X2 [Rhinatrema bivittatum]|uniref:E3 ubiquitin-protein ligase RNF138-like isoform X2 n=1 Tax=Rhinatrema bivittatum TaxID=194408 RepID=UPI0011297543|nr:E3 ubiquitin-protein ligase RNF138-like isoform X2 [Rhinatrema bivittatum]XP_029447052.1 E3 ubiquitin-protein ligase RNF138-like isoform X2 [Rhinatrema bivittatum]
MADKECSSSSISLLDDDEFDCPICQEVLQAPVRTMSCNHVFCRKCFLLAVKARGSHCPFCRGPVLRKERSVPKRDIDMENKMKRFSSACKCCGKQVKLYMMRRHYKSCKKYQEEFGSVPEHPELQLFQDSVGNSNSTETSDSDSLNDLSTFHSFQENRRSVLCVLPYPGEILLGLLQICLPISLQDTNLTMENLWIGWNCDGLEPFLTVSLNLCLRLCHPLSLLYELLD